MNANLRSGSSVVAKRHLKFADDEADDSFHTADEGNTTLDTVELSVNQRLDKKESFSESESDDDAPEEAGMNTGKTVMEEKIKAQEKALNSEKKLQKEKRKMQQKVFKSQQLLKKSKKDIEREKMLKFELELKSREVGEGAAEEPEELPEEFFAELENTNKVDILENKPKHINFRDIEANPSQDIKLEIKRQKKRTLKELRKTQVRAGPVTVSMLSSIGLAKTLAPKRESGVMNSRDKWLKRRILKRK